MQMAYMLLLSFNLNVMSTIQGHVLTYVKGLYDGYLAGGVIVRNLKKHLRWIMDLSLQAICLRQSER